MEMVSTKKCDVLKDTTANGVSACTTDKLCRADQARFSKLILEVCKVSGFRYPIGSEQDAISR